MLHTDVVCEWTCCAAGLMEPLISQTVMIIPRQPGCCISASIWASSFLHAVACAETAKHHLHMYTCYATTASIYETQSGIWPTIWHQTTHAAPCYARGLPTSDHSSGAVTPLVKGHDFFSNPRFSPDGSKLAWICWDFPNMPWDGTQLMVADVAADGTIGSATL